MMNFIKVIDMMISMMTIWLRIVTRENDYLLLRFTYVPAIYQMIRAYYLKQTPIP